MDNESSSVFPEAASDFLRKLYSDESTDATNLYLKVATSKGWSLRKLGAAMGVSAETVRNRIKDFTPDQIALPPGAPEIPQYVPEKRIAKTQPKKVSRYVIPKDVAKKMSALRDSAAKVSRHTPEDAQSRQDSAALAFLMSQQKGFGATYQEIAKATGLKSWAAVKFRLGRHGYVELPPSMADEAIT